MTIIAIVGAIVGAALAAGGVLAIPYAHPGRQTQWYAALSLLGWALLIGSLYIGGGWK